MYKLNLKSTLAIIMALVNFVGCATIMSGPSQKIGISSIPSNAKVTVDNKEVGVTPVFTKLSRKNTHIVKIELDGYFPSEITLNKKTNGWVWGNVLIVGLIGLAVDAITGSIYSLTPDQINAEMRKSDTGMLQIKNGIIIATVLQADPSWKKIGNLVKAN